MRHEVAAAGAARRHNRRQLRCALLLNFFLFNSISVTLLLCVWISPFADVLRKLEVNHLSIPVTVGLFDSQLLLDPSLAEEEVLHGLVTCSFALPSGALNYLHQVRLLFHFIEGVWGFVCIFLNAQTRSQDTYSVVTHNPLTLLLKFTECVRGKHQSRATGDRNGGRSRESSRFVQAAFSPAAAQVILLIEVL